VETRVDCDVASRPLSEEDFTSCHAKCQPRSSYAAPSPLRYGHHMKGQALHTLAGIYVPELTYCHCVLSQVFDFPYHGFIRHAALGTSRSHIYCKCQEALKETYKNHLPAIRVRGTSVPVDVLF
jgi:hypothetical protein